MATRDELECLAGKVLTDAEFRDAFVNDPAEAAASAGVELDEEEIEAAKRIEPEALYALAQQVDEISNGVTAKWGK